MTPLPPYEHLDPDPLDVTPRDDVPYLPRSSYTSSTGGQFRSKPGVPRAVIGWLLVSLAVVLLVTVSVALFLRGFGA